MRVFPPKMAQVSCGVVLPQETLTGGLAGSVGLFHPTEVHSCAAVVGTYLELVGCFLQEFWQEQQQTLDFCKHSGLE